MKKSALSIVLGLSLAIGWVSMAGATEEKHFPAPTTLSPEMTASVTAAPPPLWLNGVAKPADITPIAKAYAESAQWVLENPAEAAALAEEYLDMNAAVVETAIPNMGLTFKSAQDAREELDTFYQLLNDFDPSMIGGALPDDGLYYAG